MSYSVFGLNEVAHTKQTLFLGEPVAIARYDTVKYPQLEKLTEKQMGFFWRPQEVELSRDKKDFSTLTGEQEHIFTSNLKRQILLDSVQGRALSLAFGSIVSLPELEAWFKTQEFFEQIHSRSYSHIIRNVYPNPDKVFDEMLQLQEIVDCASDISIEYDKLIEYNSRSVLNENIDQKEYKRQIWRTLYAVNALEGIRFYVSFACSWAFAEQGRMEGNAKIIKFIARDENIHLAATQQLIKLLPKDDPDFAIIAKEDRDYCINMFKSVVSQEKEWAKYLFSKGAMLGLNYDILCEFVDHIAFKRATAIGIGSEFKNTQNPLPWVAKWIAGSDVQVAPQQTQLTTYTTGDTKMDVNEDSFKSFKL